jgi:mannose-6-phosphate isomerase
MSTVAALYPLKFTPRFVEKMWGGTQLQAVGLKQLPPGKQIGESWELYDFPPGTVGPDASSPEDRPGKWVSSVVSNGPLAGTSLHSIMTLRASELLGTAKPVSTSDGPQFPLLIKFLDAREDLSVQVHPPQHYVAKHAGAYLKNECWHVLAADPKARILLGTKSGTDRAMFEQSIEMGACESLLNAIEVKVGDTFYLPSGTVHALGAGIVAAEVQTPSDTTYRVYDFNRVEPSTGKPRKLHVAQALECIDFKTDTKKCWTPPGDEEAVIVTAPQFNVVRRDAQPGDTPNRFKQLRVMILLEGTGILRGNDHDDVPYSRGETIVIPASAEGYIIPETYTRWLEVYLPR